MDAAVEEAETGVLEASKELLDDRDILDTPLGEIEFAVDTQGRDYSVVQLQMEEGGVTMDTLFKTDAEGNPLVFRSEILSYSAEDGPIEDWLSTLNYGIYDYSSRTTLAQSPMFSINSSESSLASSLLANKPLFDMNQIKTIDGSAFLIDLDQNDTIDLVSMLLVDQGWFDTRKDIIGLIGDPLIPATTQAKVKVEELSQSVETAGNPNATQETDEGSIPDQDKGSPIPTETSNESDSSPFDQQNPDEPTRRSNNPIDGQGNRTQNENNNRSNRTQIDANGQFALSSNPPNTRPKPADLLGEKA